jgi:uncharacterized protein YfaS (alpha-2-macroglobulin family)
MPNLSRLILLLAFCFIAPVALAQNATFSHSGLARDAERYESYLKSHWKAGQQTAAQLRQTGVKALAEGNDPRAASRSFAAAVAADARDAESWTGLARALLGIKPDTGSERYELPVNAAAAAYIAYQRSQTAAHKAAALAVLAEGLKRRSMWRPALDALKASLALIDNAEVRQAYDALYAEHGFRVVDYKVDADATEPRLCLNFSERVSTGPSDPAKFVSLDGKDPQNVSVEGNQACIDGLAHGKRYEVQVRAGLPSAAGEALSKTSEIAVYVRDRGPSVRFTGRNYVLPSRGQLGIPIVTVNTDKVAVEILRFGDRGLIGAVAGDSFLRQVESYELESMRERSSQRVWKGELAVASRLNEDVTTALPVTEAVSKLEPGVYLVSARPASESSGNRNIATQWFIVSDLGMTSFSSDDGLHAFVRSLATAKPVADVNVRLVARNNEVLGTGKTDGNGYVRFDAGLKRGTGGMAPALLIAESNQDYAFLDLATAAFDLSDRGVKGRETPGAIDAYLYADRGVYRPGESVNLTGIVRDAEAKAAGLPVTLVVTRPDGVEHRRMALTDQGLGGRTVALPLASAAMTGTWRARVYTDPAAGPLAQVSFLVEDFVPERLELKLEAQSEAVSIEEAAKIAVRGRYLYGPPAANLALEGEVVVRPSASGVANFPGYRFGLEDERTTAVRKEFDDLPSTGVSGEAVITLGLPAIPRTARPLEADVLVRLREPGGRAIERKLTLPVKAAEARVGIKPLFSGNEVGEGETALFDAIVLATDGKTIESKPLKWELLRLDRHWQWYSRDGQWNYEPQTTTRRITGGKVESEGGQPARIAVQADWGRYRLEVTTLEPGGPLSSVTFNAGWYASDNVDSPELLDLALDKPSYRAGDTARIRIVTKQAGTVAIAVLSNKLLALQHADIAAGGGEIALPVSESWLPGAYVTATLYRPLDEKAKRMPGRAIGVKWLSVDTSGRTLKVALDAPQKAKPGTSLVVPVKIDGLGAGEEARLTVAAVDVGILNLTRFESPAPEKWFFAQRRLGTEIRDFYGRLIDGMRAERGSLRSGGDGSGGMGMQGSPPVEKPLSLFSGIVRIGPDGTGSVRFELPDFNGTVRLMAAAWSNSKVGSASTDVIVRDALALTASVPRFLSLGDESRLEIDVHNVEGPAAAYKLTIEQEAASGLKTGLASRELELKAGERRREHVSLRPNEIGLFIYSIAVSGPGGIESRRRLALDVKPPAGDIKRTTVSTLAAKGGKLSLSADLLQDLIPSTARVSVSVGTLARMDVPGLLAQLDRYPYGCAEQTTSRALPLLYVNDMAKRLGLAAESRLKERIEKAIERVFDMQDSSGAFGVWGPHSGDMWLSSYVTDFLTRAKELGYAVRAQAFGQALDRLQNYLSYAQDFERGGEARAYALYVLARNGRAPIGELRYYVDTRLDRFTTPLAQAQLGAALAMMGDKERAERAFRVALAHVAPEDKLPGRTDYGSAVRDGAALVTLAAETGVAKSEQPRLASVIAKAFQARSYTSTQEQAWMLLAARALSEQSHTAPLDINGVSHTGEFSRTISAADLKGTALTIRNDGEGPLDAVVSVIGSALTPEPAIAKGFSIERSYYTLDGEQVDLKSADGGTSTLKQTDRLVVVLKIEGAEAGGRVLLVDRLPAGLEIENPRLVDSGDIRALGWLKRSKEPQHTEFRDDRFVAAFDFFGEGRGGSNGSSQPSAIVAYIVRAVTPGSFVHPAATVEDMYRPDRFARTAAGRLEITPR